MEIATAQSPSSLSTKVDSARRDRRRKQRALGKLLRRLAWIALAIGLATLMILAWLPKPIAVDMHVVRRGTMQIVVEDSGRTRVKDRHIVSAPIAGNVSRIELHPNDRVDRSAIVARIEPLAPMLLDPRTKAETAARLSAATASARQAGAALERARVAAAKADSDFAENQELARNGVISEHLLEQAEFERRLRKEELSAAQFANQVAQHEIEVVRAALRRSAGGSGDEFSVTSPAAGRILKVLHESAGVVQAGTPLLEIGDPAALEIVTDVLTADAVHIRPSTPVTIERWGGSAPLAGHVRYVEPSAFTRLSALGVEEQRVNVVVDLDEPYEKWEALGDGYRVETRIVIWRANDVLTVPSSSAFRRGEGWSVFTVEDGVARQRSIEVGQRNDADFEVTRGLEAGAVVILHPSERVADGQRVAAR